METHLGFVVLLAALAHGVVRGRLACVAELSGFLLHELLVGLPLGVGICLCLGVVVVAASCHSKTADDVEKAVASSTLWFRDVVGLWRVCRLGGVWDGRIGTWTLRILYGVSQMLI